MADGIHIATRSFATYVDGKKVIIRKGVTRVREGHQLLRENPDRFKPIDVHYDVESARQEPGEKRVGKRTAKKTAAKKTGDA